MFFDRLRIGDVVQWDKRCILMNLDTIPNAHLWVQEEFNCLLQVTKYRSDAMGADCELECVDDCGTHVTTTLTREEYLEYFDALGTDIIMFADSAEASLMYDAVIESLNKAKVEEEKSYDFLNDFKSILKKVAEGNLPSVTHKGKNKCQM